MLTIAPCLDTGIQLFIAHPISATEAAGFLRQTTFEAFASLVLWTNDWIGDGHGCENKAGGIVSGGCYIGGDGLGKDDEEGDD